jgi:SAM-dependent methyltransferase
MSPQDRQSSPNRDLVQEKYLPNAGLLYRISVARFFKTLSSLLAKTSGDLVLDAGCGEGYVYLNYLVGTFNRVYGADLDYRRLRYSIDQHPRLKVINGNIQNIPFAANTFDLVVCLEVLEHVGNPEQALAELHRVTKRYTILSVPNEPLWRIGNMLRGAYWRQWGNTPEHINHWSVWGFKRFVLQHFRIVAVANPVTWTFILAEKK